jgi:hypothetical protein
MAHSYPIWVEVEACIYNSTKSYGVKNTGNQTYHVGTSASNSHQFIRTSIERKECEPPEDLKIEKYKKCQRFRFFVKDTKIKEMYVIDENSYVTFDLLKELETSK